MAAVLLGVFLLLLWSFDFRSEEHSAANAMHASGNLQSGRHLQELQADAGCKM